MIGRARRPGVVSLLALLAMSAGCGYSLRGTLPGHIKTVAVPVFRNLTSEPAVENFLTRAVVEAFSTNGRLQVVTAEQADSILEGEVTRYNVQSVAFDPNANIKLYRLTVTLNLRFRDLREGTVMFERRGVEERADFRVPGTVSETIAREEIALRTAAQEIGRSVVAFTVERF